MTKAEAMSWLEANGTESIRNVLRKHGAPDNILGVKVGDMKILMKQSGKDHALALELYRSGNPDAQYFAGLIAHPAKMDRNELQYWGEHASWHMISDYSVAWNAAESAYAVECGLNWIDTGTELLASAGWCTLAYRSQLAVDVDPDLYKMLVGRVQQKLHQSPSQVRYSMNGFLIAAGSSLPFLTALCKETARALGKINVYMGSTSCKVPEAVTYIDKAIARGSYTKRKKTVKC